MQRILVYDSLHRIEHIPLIGKDGDDVIDNITCELTGTESINLRT